MFSAMYPLFLPGLQLLIADAVLASSKHVQGLRKQGEFGIGMGPTLCQHNLCHGDVSMHGTIRILPRPAKTLPSGCRAAGHGPAYLFILSLLCGSEQSPTWFWGKKGKSTLESVLTCTRLKARWE